MISNWSIAKNGEFCTSYVERGSLMERSIASTIRAASSGNCGRIAIVIDATRGIAACAEHLPQEYERIYYELRIERSNELLRETMEKHESAIRELIAALDGRPR